MIRTLVPQDADAAAAVHAKCFDRPWAANDMAAHIDADVALGFFDNELVGFVLARFAFDQAEILTIAVDPDHRKKGIGQELLQNAEETCVWCGANVVFLEVAEDNPAAIALYKGAFYQQIGARPGYYKREHGRVGALTFRKTLDG